ncbi:MAG: class I poly(R)-hydroxyalkanoic acid synthase [Pseudomonadota bacterium]
MPDNARPATGPWADWLQHVTQINGKIVSEMASKYATAPDTGMSVWFDVLDASRSFFSANSAHPGTLLDEQMDLWRTQMALWNNLVQRLGGRDVPPLTEPDKGDNRFSDAEWRDNPLFDFLRQSYLINARAVLGSIERSDGIDEKTRQRLRFFARQMINALAPTNFVATNPEILRLTAETGGQNLVKGLEQYLEDLEKSADSLNIRMSDESAFRVGGNIATSPGKVVFRNRMMELIQYTPSTETAHKRPLLMIPPWINKFYIVDLRESNSFVRWAVKEGHTVFMVSWVNPDASYRDVGIDEYLLEGLVAALDAIEQATGEKSVNAIGYCAGGILLSMGLAWLAARGEGDRIATGTCFATLFDYTDPGDIGAFIDDNVVNALEQRIEKDGVFDGRMMAVVFALLRENDLYWNYYVQNYLKGERPVPFDLLYWNSDCTNLPAAVHKFFLRKLYIQNLLRVPGGVTVAGEPIDLGKVKVPVFILATLQDHIAKWRSSYAGTQLLGGPVRFVLGESGHIAGVINPPGGKYGYFTSDDMPTDPEHWWQHAQRHDGSWWTYWKAWIAPHTGGGEVPARQPGDGKLVPLCDAPGTYVHKRVVDILGQRTGT